MKTFFFTLLTSALCSISAMAQAGGNQATSGTAAPAAKGATAAPAFEGIVKQGARVALIRGSTVTLLDQALTLPNGTRVDADGTVTLADRTQSKLQPNQMVTLTGLIAPLPAGAPVPVVNAGDHTQATKTTSEASAPAVKAGEGGTAR